MNIKFLEDDLVPSSLDLPPILQAVTVWLT